ncbi:MAG: DUF5683 domain-containing protein [bacterium]
MRFGIVPRQKIAVYFLCAMVLSVPLRADAEPLGKKKIYLKRYTPRNAAIKSALLPGWGQYANHREGKAYAIAITEIITLSSAYALFYTAQDKYDEYTDKGLKDDELYDDYESYMQGSLIAGGLSVGIWLYSIAEAYVFARDEIKRRNRESSLRLHYDGTKTVLAYQRKF